MGLVIFQVAMTALLFVNYVFWARRVARRRQLRGEKPWPGWLAGTSWIGIVLLLLWAIFRAWMFVRCPGLPNACRWFF